MFSTWKSTWTIGAHSYAGSINVGAIPGSIERIASGPGFRKRTCPSRARVCVLLNNANFVFENFAKFPSFAFQAPLPTSRQARLLTNGSIQAKNLNFEFKAKSFRRHVGRFTYKPPERAPNEMGLRFGIKFFLRFFARLALSHCMLLFMFLTEKYIQKEIIC